MSVVSFFVLHGLQSLDLNQRFDGSLGPIFGSNLGNKLSNKNILELLFLLFIHLVLLSKSLDRSGMAFSDQKASAIDFNNCKPLFLPCIL